MNPRRIAGRPNVTRRLLVASVHLLSLRVSTTRRGLTTSPDCLRRRSSDAWLVGPIWTVTRLSTGGAYSGGRCTAARGAASGAARKTGSLEFDDLVGDRP